jgi:hypothetical protein
MTMASFQERMIGAARGEAATFREVRDDASALGQAAAVVALAGAARAIGIALSFFALRWGPVSVFAGLLTTLFGWAIGGAVLWVVGTRLLPGRTTNVDIPVVLRTTGFAFVPLIASVLAFIPILGWLVSLAAGLWSLYLIVVATRETFDYADLGRAVLACLVALVIVFFAMIVLNVILAMLGFGLASFFMFGR